MEAADAPPPMNLGAAATRLRLLFRSAFPSHATELTRDLDGLRDAVCSYVRSAKAVGQHPPEIVKAVKQMAYECVSRETRARDYAELTDGIARWCVDEYYGADPERDAQAPARVPAPIHREHGDANP